MWAELHEHKGITVLVNMDHVLRVVQEADYRALVFLDHRLRVDESYQEIRQMVYPKSNERAAPVYVDTSR